MTIICPEPGLISRYEHVYYTNFKPAKYSDLRVRAFKRLCGNSTGRTYNATETVNVSLRAICLFHWYGNVKDKMRVLTVTFISDMADFDVSSSCEVLNFGFSVNVKMIYLPSFDHILFPSFYMFCYFYIILFSVFFKTITPQSDCDWLIMIRPRGRPLPQTKTLSHIAKMKGEG